LSDSKGELFHQSGLSPTVAADDKDHLPLTGQRRVEGTAQLRQPRLAGHKDASFSARPTFPARMRWYRTVVSSDGPTPSSSSRTRIHTRYWRKATVRWPAWAYNPIGISLPDPDATLTAQLFGGALLTYCFVAWFARDAETPRHGEPLSLGSSSP